MEFLIISKDKYMTAPAVVPSLIDATLAWARKYEGQIDQIWSFAGRLWSFTGQQAEEGVANVESREELDTILAEFPLRPFSETEVYPLADLDVSLQQQKETLQSVSAPV
jgi:muconolactone delta-isomerase